MTPPSSFDLSLDPSVTMIEILRRWPQVGPALLAAGVPCMGCAMARFHTITDAAAANALDEIALKRILIDAILA